MGILVSDADIDHIRSLYPLLEIRALTPQQEKFVNMVLKAYSVTAAERAAGYAPGVGKKLLNEPHIQAVLAYFREHKLNDIKITRETLTEMLLGSHSKAANASEEIMAARELGKLHDLYESDKHKGIKIQNNINNINGATPQGGVTSMKQVERMRDEDLFRLAGMPAEALDPMPIERRVPVIIEHVKE